jgi:hypothetical protein
VQQSGVTKQVAVVDIGGFGEPGADGPMGPAGPAGAPGEPGEPGVVISDTPPVDTEVLWADTTEASELQADTVRVFTYETESEPRPDATVVFWVPVPTTIGNPTAALPGDCVLRTTENPVQGINGITGLWQGTAAEYEALSSLDPNTVYFIVAA